MLNVGDVFGQIDENTYRKINTKLGIKAVQHVKLSDLGFYVGQLVTLKGQGLDSGGILYRIVADNEPLLDAVYAEVNGRGFARARGNLGWTMPKKKGKRPSKAKNVMVSMTRLMGNVILDPVFSFMPARKVAKKRTVPYRQIDNRLSNVDIVGLCSTFASYQTFINEEVKRLGG